MAKVLVLCGGDNPERRVSLDGGDAVARGLSEAGHEVMKIDSADPRRVVGPETALLGSPVGQAPPAETRAARLDREGWLHLMRALLTSGVDTVFPILHGSWGEDGHIQALLELGGLPFLGSAMSASSLAMDKGATLARARTLGIPVAEGWLVDDLEEVGDAFDRAAALDDEGRVVVKPNRGGSSTDMALGADRTLALGVAGRILATGDRVLVERFVAGRELTVAVLDGRAYPVLEIAPREGFYDYTNKYTKGKTDYLCPAPIDGAVAEAVQRQAKAIHDELGCRHLARVDFRLGEDGTARLLEINTIPGMTALSLVPMAAKAEGIDFAGLMDRFVTWSLRDAPRSVGSPEDQ